MPSNLPPGCSSADGGIDHAMEAAIETLVDAIPSGATAESVLAVAASLPAMFKIFDGGVDAAVNEIGTD